VNLSRRGKNIRKFPFETEAMKIHTLGIFIALAFVESLPHTALAQEKNQMVRMAKLVIDSAQLARYNVLLKEEIETSVRVEPGVMTLYALSEKKRPTHITILEIYANEDSYRSHLKTPHFLKYRNGTKDMVKSLELIEGIPLVPGMKIK
jgi:quinol monooxygenase YgiN